MICASINICIPRPTDPCKNPVLKLGDHPPRNAEFAPSTDGMANSVRNGPPPMHVWRRIKRGCTVYCLIFSTVRSRPPDLRHHENASLLCPPLRPWSGHDGSPTQPKDAAGLRAPAMKRTSNNENAYNVELVMLHHRGATA